MFCPYVIKAHTRITKIHYNDDSIEDGSIVHEVYSNAECKKEECGTWYEGRCRYNEDND